MFERFSDRARKVMALANQEAQRFNHEYIGTEHILLGLVKEGSGDGAKALISRGVDLRKVRLEVERLVKSGPHMVATGKLAQSPRAKKVIEFAIEEARDLNHNHVGTEHLLLRLLREQEGVAAQVLTNFGVGPEHAREEVRNLLSEGPTPSPESAGGEDAGLRANLPQATEDGGHADGRAFEEFFAHDAAAALLQSLLRELAARKDRAVMVTDYEKAVAYRDLALAASQLLDQLASVLSRGRHPKDEG